VLARGGGKGSLSSPGKKKLAHKMLFKTNNSVVALTP